jgi:hypothetical protein
MAAFALDARLGVAGSGLAQRLSGYRGNLARNPSMLALRIMLGRIDDLEDHIAHVIASGVPVGASGPAG